MAYQALYRKFRPTVFGDVIGQSHITNTLSNQIKAGSFGHAYLFTGTRGTGKTSSAKIFSRSVNCLNPNEGNPCNECEICKGILDESLMDVIEMDAASNNSVEDIREIRENVKYPPSKGKYKVYIIDEVHMLSQGAFNALLKTLEEPPSYVIFILATTEPQKIPNTILSRCQRYDFKRVSNKDLLGRLEFICQAEEVEYETSALNIIVELAEGAVRDALSLLDQCMSFVSDKIDDELIQESLGLVQDDLLIGLIESVYNRDGNKALSIIQEIIDNGKDIVQFLKSMIQFLRHVMILKTSGSTTSIIDTTDERLEKMQKLAEMLDMNFILRLLEIFHQIISESKQSTNKRILLEMGIIKAIQPKYEESYEALIDRITALETQLKNGVVVKEDSEKKVEKKAEPKPKTKAVKKVPVSSGEASDEFNAIKGQWDEVLRRVKKTNPTVYALIIEGKPLYITARNLNLGFKSEFAFHMIRLSNPEESKVVDSIINEMFDTDLSIKCIEVNGLEEDAEEEVEASEETDFFEGFENVLEIED